MEKELKEIKKYIDSNMDEIYKLMNKRKRIAILQLLTMGAMVASVFSPVFILWLLAFNIWVGLMIYEHHTMANPISRKFGEIHGCFKTLRILGIIDESPPDIPKKKTKKWYEKMYEETQRLIGNIKWQPKQGFA